MTLVVAVNASAPSDALAALPIRPPHIHVTPPVELRIPSITQRELTVAGESTTRYGDAAAPLETQLDGLRSDATARLDTDVHAIGRTSEARAAVRECVGDALQSIAKGYGAALADYATTGTHDFPGIYESVSSAASGCIESQTGAPSDVVEPTAEYLAAQLHGQFATVADTTESGPAQQRWLELLASDVTAPRDSPPGPSPSSPSSDDPPAALVAGVAGGLALLALAGVIALRSRRQA